MVKLRGKPFFEYLDSNPELAESFNNAMTAGSEFAIYAVLAAYDLSGYRKIVDIGGGHGRLLSMILEKAPNAHFGDSLPVRVSAVRTDPWNVERNEP